MFTKRKCSNTFSTEKSAKCGVSEMKQGMRKARKDEEKKVKCTTNEEKLEKSERK